MRSQLSRALLRRFEHHSPAFLKAIELQVLLNLASRSFHLPGRRIWNLSPEKALEAYTAYTCRCMESGTADPQTLYRQAFQVGSRVRGLTGLTAQEDLERLIFYLYRNLCISMSGRLPGEILVSSCSFGSVYTPEQCRIMSNVDSGIIAGIIGGGSLAFSERITEGCGRCRACFVQGGKAS